jgi:hypothetical protein
MKAKQDQGLSPKKQKQALTQNFKNQILKEMQAYKILFHNFS